MFKLKNQFQIIIIYLFTFLGLLFITNNYYVMAMDNNDGISENNSVIDNHIDEYNFVVFLIRVLLVGFTLIM
ncbi:SVM family protein [Candidatus Phytoplasma citri]|uniref:Sequence-variable mosaic (SVM) signal sequence domain-containing protein n=1 Tax=Candidatus Phytoplasma citri TaxID=180978 RepID=A0A1S9M3E8_9MOLU|nr:SVM family protein [Candidatus Phytoplasma aurantifolia]OOP59790.1 hypothetical protein B2G44_00610 [Candidatus Phytoplasma aurantifolia]